MSIHVQSNWLEVLESHVLGESQFLSTLKPSANIWKIALMHVYFFDSIGVPEAASLERQITEMLTAHAKERTGDQAILELGAFGCVWQHWFLFLPLYKTTIMLQIAVAKNAIGVKQRFYICAPHSCATVVSLALLCMMLIDVDVVAYNEPGSLLEAFEIFKYSRFTPPKQMFLHSFDLKDWTPKALPLGLGCSGC